MSPHADRIRTSLAAFGIRDVAEVFANLTRPGLFEAALRRGEGHVSEHGALVVQTGEHTGRAAKDKYVVRDATTQALVNWGEVNQPLTPAQYDGLWSRIQAFLPGKEVFVQDLYVGADQSTRLPIRVVTRRAYHSLFARNMFLRPASAEEAGRIEPQFTVVHVPDFQADPALDGTRSKTFVVLNFTARTVLIGGTSYAGEIKKAMFSVMNYLLPQQGVLTMHCSANVGHRGDVALFFGLSGTGKTTLSADPERQLIGDDEHGWSDHGVFNLEGGCYAKVINLSETAEPDIFRTTRSFATLLENVVIDPVTRAIDLDDAKLTENTRGSYSIDAIPGSIPSGMAGQPKNIVFLTADAYGVLPPIARLTVPQAMYGSITAAGSQGPLDRRSRNAERVRSPGSGHAAGAPVSSSLPTAHRRYGLGVGGAWIRPDRAGRAGAVAAEGDPGRATRRQPPAPVALVVAHPARGDQGSQPPRRDA